MLQMKQKNSMNIFQTNKKSNMTNVEFKAKFIKTLEIQNHFFEGLNLQKLGQKKCSVAFINKADCEITVPKKGVFLVKRSGETMIVEKKD